MVGRRPGPRGALGKEMLRVWTTELQGVVGDECAQCIDEDIGSLLDLLLVQVTLDYAPPR